MVNKQILITGGAGFIGAHLCRSLLEQGNSIVCLDDLSTGSLKNIAGLMTDKRFKFIEWDITRPLDCEADEIYNLACPASPVQYQQNPVLTLKTNVLGAINVLDLAHRMNARILQASTSEVYGDPHKHPQTESYWGNVNPIGLRSCYDEGKRCAETLFFDYHRQYGVDIKVVRIFNAYGPMMHPNDGRVVSNFIVQALQGSPLTVYGEGRQTRAFCYVGDMVDGLIHMMESRPRLTGPINLGNPVECSISELANLVLRLTGSTSQVIHHSLPSDDPMQRCPDVSLAKEELGWEPLVPLDTGLKLTIDYFRRK